jgi:hypothetical protein
MIPVVYTMGKVASSAVYRAVADARLPCFHIHTLAVESLQRTAKSRLEGGNFPPPHVSVSMGYREGLFTRPQRCLYISLVRDPIARNLSAFFETLHERPEEIRECTDPDELFQHFMNLYDHTIPLSWFDREFRDQLGVDVYAEGFDKQKKFKWLKAKRTVIFRTDCPDEVKGEVLSEILDREIVVRRGNDGDDKEYADLYKGVKGKARYSRDFVKTAFSSRFARHFWTVPERDAMIAKWENWGRAD